MEIPRLKKRIVKELRTRFNEKDMKGVAFILDAIYVYPFEEYVYSDECYYYEPFYVRPYINRNSLEDTTEAYVGWLGIHDRNKYNYLFGCKVDNVYKWMIENVEDMTADIFFMRARRDPVIKLKEDGTIDDVVLEEELYIRNVTVEEIDDFIKKCEEKAY